MCDTFVFEQYEVLQKYTIIKTQKQKKIIDLIIRILVQIEQHVTKRMKIFYEIPIAQQYE